MGRANAAVGVPVPLAPYPSPIAGGLTLFNHASALATATASATPHSKGAWVQVYAATSEAADWLELHVGALMQVTSQDTRGLLDIAIGAAAAEVMIIEGIPVGFCVNGWAWKVPIHIPKGSRVAMRLQSLIASDTIGLSPMLFSTSTSRRSPSKLINLNADLAASTSTTMMTVSNTWTEVTASTAEPFQGLVAFPCGGVGATWGFSDNAEQLSLGIGASGAEQLKAISPHHSWTNVEAITTSGSGGGWPQSEIHAFYSGHVPAGTRVCTKITNGRSYKGVIVFGIPYT